MAMLDTNVLIELSREMRKGQPGRATSKIDELVEQGERLQVAIFTVAELYVGVSKGDLPTYEKLWVDRCLALFDILPFEYSAALIYGELVGELERRGEIISDMDALIASVALDHGERLITRNLKHFLRVPNPHVEGF